MPRVFRGAPAAGVPVPPPSLVYRAGSPRPRDGPHELPPARPKTTLRGGHRWPLGRPTRRRPPGPRTPAPAFRQDSPHSLDYRAVDAAKGRAPLALGHRRAPLAAVRGVLGGGPYAYAIGRFDHRWLAAWKPRPARALPYGCQPTCSPRRIGTPSAVAAQARTLARCRLGRADLDTGPRAVVTTPNWKMASPDRAPPRREPALQTLKKPRGSRYPVGRLPEHAEYTLNTRVILGS